LAQRFDRNLLAYALLRAYLEDVRLRFGEFTLDTDLRQLSCGGIDRDLSPQGFELLNVLIDNRPRALSKRQIYEHLWPNVSFSDATLTSLVAEVRRALNETAIGEEFLRTVPRFGYVFHGDASRGELLDELLALRLRGTLQERMEETIDDGRRIGGALG